MSFNTHRLRTASLELVPYERRFLTERYVSWLNDPEVVKYSEQRHRRHTIETSRAYVDSFDEGPNYLWAICRPGEPGGDLDHIGNISAAVNTHYALADISIMIGEKREWGKGRGLEAWLAVCDFLFRQGMRKVTGGTLSPNRGMLTIMERAGMMPDGVRARHYVIGGEEVDIVYRALFRDDWLRRPQPGQP